MKKALHIILVLLLALSVAACGNANQTQNAGESTPTEQNNQTAGGSEGTDEPATNEEELKPEEGAQLLVWESEGAPGEWLKFVGQEFEKKYGVPVKFEVVDIIDAKERLKTDGPAGLGADVFGAPHDHVGELVTSGLILENSFPEEYESAFMKAAIDGTSYNGTLYGFPTGIETYALFYNKDLVDKAPETFEELIAMSKEINNPAENKYGFMMEVANFYYFYAFAGGYGGYVFGNGNTDPSDIGLNSEGAVKAAQFMQKLHQEILPLKVEDITYDVKNSLFDEGKLAFDINGPWAVQGHKDAGTNFGVAPLPKLDNGQVPTSFSGIRGLYVNSYTKYPIAASLFAQFATSEEMLLKRFEQTGQMPPRSALIDSPTIQNDPISLGFLQQAEYAVPMPNIPEMGSIWDPMSAALTTIWNDGADPKTALDSAVNQIKTAIQK